METQRVTSYMINKLTFLTNNVNDLNSSQKRINLFEYYRKKKIIKKTLSFSKKQTFQKIILTNNNEFSLSFFLIRNCKLP